MTDTVQPTERGHYYSERHFKLDQLFANALQVYHVHSMQPRDMLEIGVGNRFLSTFMRLSGLDVTTADINSNLQPDICAPLRDLRSATDRRFDLVVCCEVLEHIPLAELDANLDHLRSLGDRLFLTLPTIHTTAGIGGLVRLPGMGPTSIDLNFSLPRRHKLMGTPHFWEVGFDRTSTRRAIVGKLKKRYANVKSGRFPLKPNHVYFKCS